MTGVTEMGFILESATPNELVAYQAGANEKWDYVDKLRAEIERRDAVLRMAQSALEEVCGDRCNAEYNPCYAREAIKAIQEVLG